MKNFLAGGFLGCVMAASLAAPLGAESLTYVINWPSGISLGEATFSSEQKTDPKHPADPKVPSPWSFHLDIQAGVPGFNIRDAYQSASSGALCTSELKKSIYHGGKKMEETVTFDPGGNTATRKIVEGGTTQIDVPACAHDPLAFLQFARTELAHARMIPQQAVIFGAPYQVRMVLSGKETISVDGKPTETDHVQTTIKGPSRDYTIELYFARDAVRTPVLAKIPLPLGAFTVELMR